MNDQTQNIRVEKTLSDDKQFQERLAAEIQTRFAYKAQDAWKEYLRTHRHCYPDYTMEQLSKSGHEWRINWMVGEMSKSIAQITATLTDLLGVATDLRALAKAKTSTDTEKIFGDLMNRPPFRKQAE